ncbi:indoleamine 2,3-dioxygenase 2 [Huso huso]|uniref:Indoleamine 2,3-dioxygenase 2 n=1 Tax=Huso huso TaxID=61971 RepID=A0ABR0Y7T6_HUSHU
MTSSNTNTIPNVPFTLNKYHVSEEYGFLLPLPRTDLPEYYQPWMKIARNLTDLIEAHTLRNEVNKLPLLDTGYLQGHRELRLARMALSFITMGYVWQEGEHGIVKTLPRNLAIPYCALSRLLGLPPILVHADGALSNWKKKNPSGPMEIENLDLIVCLPGGDSFKGFFLVTLLVELAAVPGIKAMAAVINAVLECDDWSLKRALEDLASSIQSMTEALKQMHAHVDPATFYGMIRIFLSGWRDNSSMPEGLVYEGVQEDPLQYSGGSAAQSSVLHCFDELLGVRHGKDSAAFLSRMRDYMPSSHKQLVLDISAGPSLRHYILDVGKPELTGAFNGCVAQLMALRNYHIVVVSRFITVPAAREREKRSRAEPSAEILTRAPSSLEERGTGGSGVMSFLKSVRDTTKEAAIPWDGNKTPTA